MFVPVVRGAVVSHRTEIGGAVWSGGAAGRSRATLATMAVDTGVVACPACGRRNRVPAIARGVAQCAQCHEALPWMADADAATFDAVADSSRIAVLVDLWAPWCGPCRMVSPALERLARANAGRVKLVKVNVDEAPAIADRFGVRGIPTLLVLRRGAVVARQTGAPPEPALRAWLDDALRDADQRARRA
jgi:thioredoxin 2